MYVVYVSIYTIYTLYYGENVYYIAYQKWL